VPKINQGAMPFVQRENIVSFLSACKSKGMRETDLFVTGDLYEVSTRSKEGRPPSVALFVRCALFFALCACVFAFAPQASNMGQVVDQLCALGQLASTKGYRGPQLVISGGAVQVASPHAVVKSNQAPQVDIFAKPGNAQPAVLSSPPPVAARPAAAAAASPPAAAAGFSKFCGSCGTARADANVKFCSNCGNKF
jgi:hypothetical protein